MTILGTIAAALAALHGGQGKPLTIDEAAEIAASNAFSVRIAASNVAKNRQKVNEASAGLGPKFSVGANYNRFERATISDFGNGPVIVNPIDTKTLTAQLTMPIDLSGSIGLAIRAAEATIGASKETLEAQRNQAKLDARTTFLTVLRNRALLKVVEQSVAEAQENLRVLQSRLNSGAVAKVDVIRAETQLRAAESDRISAQNAVALSEEAFNNALARPIETPVDLVDVVALPELGMKGTEMVQAAQSSRPEVRSITRTVVALDSIRRIQENALRPSLNISINHQQAVGQIGVNSQRHSTTGTVALNWPIWDSGVARARAAQAREDVNQAKIQLEQVQLAVSLEVRQAWTTFDNARARLETAKKQLELAEENLRIARVRSKAGEGIFLEVADAQTQATQARNGVVSAKYDYLTAFAQLQKAVGKDGIAQAAP